MQVKENNQTIEKIEVQGNPKDFLGVKSSKTFRNYIQSRINRIKDVETRFVLMGILEAYNYFHPINKTKVKIQGFKGKSSIEIIKRPNHFETIQYRKTDDGIKEIKNNVTIQELKPLISCFKGLSVKKRYKTRYIAQEYCKSAEISLDSKGRAFFDDKGFNFNMFVGDRNNYCKFNIMLKILEYYGFVEYFKSGEIIILDDGFDFQSEFY